MTQAQAAETVAALVNNNYGFTCVVSSGQWTVTVSPPYPGSNSTELSASIVSSFATSEGVTAYVTGSVVLS